MAFNLARVLAQAQAHLPGADTTFKGGYPDVPVFQDQTVAASGNSYDPSSDSWTPNTGENVLPGWQQAYAQLRQGFHKPDTPEGAEDVGMQQLFQNPDFVAKWNQQYPGTLQGVANTLGLALNQWQTKGSSGAFTDAVPMMLAIAGGSLGAYLGGAGAMAGDAIPASAAGVGVEGGTGALGAAGAGGSGVAGAGSAVGSGGGDVTSLTTTDLPQGTITANQPVNTVDLTTTPQGPVSTAPADVTTAPAGVTNLPTAPAGDPSTVTMGQPGTGNLGGNMNVDQYGNVTGGGGYGGGSGGGGAAGIGGLTLQKILSGDLTADDLAKSITVGDLGKLLGTVGTTGLSMYADHERAQAMHDIYNDMSAKRQPFLDKATGWMNDPSSYINGPGQTALSGVLRGLSVHGNPMGSGTSLGIATEAGMRDWRNAVTGFSNLGLSGEDTRANVATNAANADSNIYTDLGRGISNATNPSMSLEEMLRKYGIGRGSNSGVLLT